MTGPAEVASVAPDRHDLTAGPRAGVVLLAGTPVDGKPQDDWNAEPGHRGDPYGGWAGGTLAAAGGAEPDDDVAAPGPARSRVGAQPASPSPGEVVDG